MKIIALIPCLMLDNNRQANNAALDSNMTHLSMIDEWVVYDQCFNEQDYRTNVKYIGHNPDRAGFVVPRNALLKYFYNSDADYAFWIDANSTISKPTLNDTSTVLENVKSGNLQQCDAIFSTLGIWISQDRIQCKSENDFFEKVHLLPCKNNRSYNWMHGLVIKNFKKYNNIEYYIDDRCDTKQGLAEDVYFARLLRRCVSCYVAPTIVINKPPAKTSTTFGNSDTNKYVYPPVNYPTIEKMIDENVIKHNYISISNNKLSEEIILTRNNYKKDCIKPYIPRKKKEKEIVEDSKIKLF